MTSTLWNTYLRSILFHIRGSFSFHKNVIRSSVYQKPRIRIVSTAKCPIKMAMARSGPQRSSSSPKTEPI